MSLDTQNNWESLNVLATCANANIKTKSWAGFLGPRSINACLNKIGRTLSLHIHFIKSIQNYIQVQWHLKKKKSSLRHNKTLITKQERAKLLTAED